MKGLRETKTVSLEHYWELRLQERCTLESNTYTTTKVLPSIFSYLWKKVLSLWFYHYFYHILLPGIKTWVSCIEQWLFFLVLSPLSASTFENLRTPRCKHFKIFQSVLCGFSPFNAGMTALSEQYCFRYFPRNQFGTGYESLMWKCSVREKNQKKYTILNQRNQNNQNLNRVFSSHWDGRRLECRHWNK